MDIAGLPKTRSEALAMGATHYFTGVACKHGHVAPRKTKGACVACIEAEWRASKEKRATYFQEYNKSIAGQESKKRYYAKNREAVIARATARPVEDKRAYRRAYKLANPELQKALTSFRRRRFRDATPSWLTKEQKEQIRRLYRLAMEMTATTGERYVVDHIVPLNGVCVCGMHVPWNLRVVTQDENLVKSNKME